MLKINNWKTFKELRNTFLLVEQFETERETILSLKCKISAV